MFDTHGTPPIALPSSTADRRRSNVHSGPAASDFADLLSDAGVAPPSQPSQSSGADEIARLRKERDDYQAKRDAEIRRRPQEPYPAIQIALPANEAGYQPFVTADQQKLIDSITDRYIGKSKLEFLKMWEELEANGVAPDQLARTATHFINDRGEIVDRDEASRTAARSHITGTAWTVSEL